MARNKTHNTKYSTTRNLIAALLACSVSTSATTALAGQPGDPTASISFVTSDSVTPGATITVGVMCDFNTMTNDPGLLGDPGLFLFACNRIYVSGPSSSTGTIDINSAFPHLQSAGEFVGSADVRNIAGTVGNAPGVTNRVRLFSFQQTIDSDAAHGATLSFDFRGSLIFDAGGELFSIATETPRAYDLSGSAEGTLTVDESCNAADLATPWGVLDLSDINLFVNSFLARMPPADLNGDGLYDLTDVSRFTDGFTGGCP